MSQNKMFIIPVWCVLVFCLIWPALYNHQPFFFADTSAYLRGADAGIAKLTHHTSRWTQSTENDDRKVESLSSTKDRAVLLGRSVYYGILLCLGDWLYNLWPTILLQALCVLLALSLTLSQSGKPQPTTLATATLVLCLFSPLAFYASYLMPDIFTGIAILGMGNLIIYHLHMTRAHAATWAMLLCISALFHSSNLLLLITMAVAYAAVTAFTDRRFSKTVIAAFLLAIMCGVAGEALFSFGVKAVLKSDPIRPPFITARLLEEGTGADYLRATCPQSGFEVCHFIDHLPVSNSDDFLWSQDPKLGGFAIASPEARHRLGDEQYRFAIAVFQHAPWAQIKASLKDAGKQLAMFGLSEFSGFRQTAAFYNDHLPADYMNQLRQSAAWGQNVSSQIVTYASGVGALAALCLIAAAFFYPALRKQISPDLRALIIVCAAGLLTNDVLCGALSTPHERYQMRAIWIIPLLGLMILDKIRRKQV
ncbi:MAG: hypothetical protein JO126_00170 [Alphaproteobacteria bacterium]|nr:hypothetical protein [Alphaproteobacteria bacterium]MBV8547858.1 hypothetical protein [Alphaproteobacteria bacterium]